MTPRRLAALEYAAQGWPVVVLHGWENGACTCRKAGCPSPAKHPRSAHGLKDASTDRAVVEGWWERWPASNVGLLTGEAFDVLDIDGEKGDRALGVVAQAAGDRQMRTEGPMTSTGKGWHLFFQPTGEGNRVGLVPQADWRGRGGYIVAPPSVHASGRRYEWLPGLGPDTDFEVAPPWLLSLVRPSARVLATTVSIPGRGDRYGRRALEAEVGRVALAPVGTRNDTLNRAAFSLGQLVASGELTPADVADALLSVALRAGLSDHEATATIVSGLQRGIERPRRRTA